MAFLISGRNFHFQEKKDTVNSNGRSLKINLKSSNQLIINEIHKPCFNDEQRPSSYKNLKISSWLFYTVKWILINASTSKSSVSKDDKYNIW